MIVWVIGFNINVVGSRVHLFILKSRFVESDFLLLWRVPFDLVE